MYKCPVCGSGTGDGFQLRGLTLSRCMGCHLLFQPDPSPELAWYSKEEYYSHWGLSRDFRSVWDMKLESSLDYLKFTRKLSGDSHARFSKLLDVGCAHGYMLEAGRMLDYESRGIEVSPAADFALSRGFQVYKGQLQDAKFPEEYFDLVTMIDVIEHIRAPLSQLEETSRLLTPGGGLLILTPNVDASIVRVLGGRWPHFKPEHLCYYCPHSIRNLLSRAGFDVRRVRIGFKRLNFRYVSGHFRKFSRDWWLTGLVLGLDRVLPQNITAANLKIPTEMLVFARKR